MSEAEKLEPTREGLIAARQIVWVETTRDNRYRVSILGTWVGVSCDSEEQAERGAAFYQAHISQAIDRVSQQREQAAYERGKQEGMAEGAREERARIVEGINRLITEYIKSPGIEFSHTLTAKMALEDAINIVNQTK